MTPNTYQGKHETESAWRKIYENDHPPSYHRQAELRLDIPLTLKPGQGCGLYIHSTLPGDEAIVYDNQRGMVTHEDNFIVVEPGMAHLSSVPFSPFGYG